jgi:hypothetical protein
MDETTLAAIVAAHRSGFLASPPPAEASSHLLEDPEPQPKRTPRRVIEFRLLLAIVLAGFFGPLLLMHIAASILAR